MSRQPSVSAPTQSDPPWQLSCMGQTISPEIPFPPKQIGASNKYLKIARVLNRKRKGKKCSQCVQPVTWKWEIRKGSARSSCPTDVQTLSLPLDHPQVLAILPQLSANVALYMFYSSSISWDHSSPDAWVNIGLEMPRRAHRSASNCDMDKNQCLRYWR
jgi:hypothetical protein